MVTLWQSSASGTLCHVESYMSTHSGSKVCTIYTDVLILQVVWAAIPWQALCIVAMWYWILLFEPPKAGWHVLVIPSRVQVKLSRCFLFVSSSTVTLSDCGMEFCCSNFCKSWQGSATVSDTLGLSSCVNANICVYYARKSSCTQNHGNDAYSMCEKRYSISTRLNLNMRQMFCLFSLVCISKFLYVNLSSTCWGQVYFLVGQADLIGHLTFLWLIWLLVELWASLK